MWKHGSTLGFVNVSWHNPHFVLKFPFSPLKLTLLLLEDDDPFTVIGEELGNDWGEIERNSDSISDSMEFAAGIESNDEVGEAIFNSPSSLSFSPHKQTEAPVHPCVWRLPFRIR